MIKCKTENGKTRIRLSGYPETLTADTMMIIESVHNGIKKKSEAAAAIYLRYIAEMLEAPDLPFQVKNPLQDEVERLKKRVASMTAHIRKHTDPDDLCKLCRHFAQCQEEGDNEDDKTTRFWRCDYGQEFEYKEVE